MKKVIIFILSIIVFVSCSNETKVPETENYYSVAVNYHDRDLKQSSWDELKSTIRDTLIEFDDKTIKIGSFASYRKACDRGFELFADSLIPNFNVFYKDSILQNDYLPIYFVGKYLDRPGLYKTDLLKVNPELVWSKWGRKIMHLYRSNSRKNFFFTTSLHDALHGGFPLIMVSRLYRFSRTDEEISLVNNFGNVMNISGNWETDSSFANYYTVLDSMRTSKFIQFKYDYDISGTIANTTERVFELVEDGIPVPKFTNFNHVSPNHRYKIVTAKNDTSTVLNIIDELNGSYNFIDTLSGNMRDNDWNEVGDYLFLTEELSQDSTKLLIINLTEMKLMKKFIGIGEYNFMVIGNLLFFDSGFDEDAFITLYRYRKDETFAEIRVPGGCGLNNIPKAEKLF